MKMAENTHDLKNATSDQDKITRREFAKQTVAGTAMLAAASAGALELVAQSPAGPGLNKQVVAALGSVFIPSRPGDPGYKDLESHGITDYVLEGLPVGGDVGGDPRREIEESGSIEHEALEAFNSTAKEFFGGKTFLDLDEKQREEYLGLIVDGKKIADAQLRIRLQAFYRGARARILSVYYSNYPEHEIKRDAKGKPILKPGDPHQITNPNTTKIVTGWDICGFSGPLTWEEEERRRAIAKKTSNYWFEGYHVKLDNPLPPARPTKTSDGKDYYDVVVVGGGLGGCIIAGRLAERGINPKTGDRLRVAMIEGGPDWTIQDPGLRPGYGSPIRRSMITNIHDGIGPEGHVMGPDYRYPDRVRGGPAAYNFRLVGGCSMHWGAVVWIPDEDNFRFWRDASGVDWHLGEFADAIQEARDVFPIMSTPDSWWKKSDDLWADACKANGFEIYRNYTAARNPLGTMYDGMHHQFLSRYDIKGTGLPWAYIGLQNGLKVIANAEVEKVLIEKSPGARPVATGVVYKDQSGAMHELRAARVIVACGANWVPLVLYKSGYGPREFLGDRLLVENKNVGAHLTGDGGGGGGATCYYDDPIDENIAVRNAEPYAAVTPKPWSELAIFTGKGVPYQAFPYDAAVGRDAPQYGWEHKEYMRNYSGLKRSMSISAGFGGIPYSWRVMPPDGRMERVSIDAPRIEAAIKQCEEVTRAMVEKLPIKPKRVEFRRSRRAVDIGMSHFSGTARAGESRENSVCNSDFDCHDIDHLMISSAAAIPRTFRWAGGPTAIVGCYGWRRMVANHFTRGCSTKGFA
ncbi:MAG: hypothetical protein A3J28_15410 [Acidobacteria bacterium RIFCSPLOWO2_12_FULL_60_22]|nr:MAG: hypothetical protein A3J28_15410 [Acidobacteria bacterium RIFCSPLOWO2_12_FULL_60_22]